MEETLICTLNDTRVLWDFDCNDRADRLFYNNRKFANDDRDRFFFRIQLKFAKN